jgi:hypothetical protein
MSRSPAIAVLTVAAVLVAGGSAAALNARVLDAHQPSSVGTADAYLPEDVPEETPSETSTGLGAPTGASLTPEPTEGDESATEQAPTLPAATRASSTRTSHATATPTRTRTHSAAPRPSHSASASSHDDGGVQSPDPSPSEQHDD